MDLSTLDTVTAAEQGATMEVRHPVSNAVLTQDDGTAVSITLVGSDSERFRKAERANTNRRLAANAGRRGGSKVTSEELEADALELLCAATISWKGIVLKNETLECTKDNARRVYKALPWLREQVDAFIAERANFLTASSTN